MRYHVATKQIREPAGDTSGCGTALHPSVLSGGMNIIDGGLKCWGR